MENIATLETREHCPRMHPGENQSTEYSCSHWPRGNNHVQTQNGLEGIGASFDDDTLVSA
jgi:hypothetical protein